MGDSVTVAYVHSNDVAHSWHLSLLQMIGYDLANGGRVVNGGWLAMRCGTDGLSAARNLAVAKFLREKDSDWLFWIDTDMGFAPDTIERLLAAADPSARPIVGALCFAQKEKSPDGLGGYRCAPRPTIFDWVGVGFQGRSQYPVNALVKCSATGSAAILIHRSVLEKIADEQGPTWYDRIPKNDGDRFGEDMSFCIRAGSVNTPIHVHTGVRTSHLKQLWLQEQDYWEHAVPPPATEQCAVVVPVMKRPQNAEPFMRSLRASTGMVKVYVMADAGDIETKEAWRAAGADEVHTGTLETFAKKINQGYVVSGEPWVFIVGDDVCFQPGWLDAALAVAGDRYHVIGTNDLANPRVVTGEHATHMLIRRDYIDKVGASWDGPKNVCHEGYRHWYVDDEIVTAAKQRDVWAMALGSRVEHRHPAWGTAETDEVYELGQSFTKQDYALFAKRLAQEVASAPAGA